MENTEGGNSVVSPPIVFKRRLASQKNSLRKRNATANVPESASNGTRDDFYERSNEEEGKTIVVVPRKNDTRQLQKTNESHRLTDIGLTYMSSETASCSTPSDQYATAEATDVSSSTGRKNAKRGPMKASANVRITARFDYQPDICKDYKETGFCTFGDSCKFLHDRGDYKSGWQLDKEWDERLSRGNADEDYSVESNEREGDDELPFACLICRHEFVEPIVTKCGHFFCESCALKNYAKTTKCFACKTPTGGAFTIAHELKAKIKEKKKRILELNENSKHC